MGNKKIIQSEVHTTLDSNGDLTEKVTNKTYQLPSEPAYVKNYVTDLTAILGLPNGAKDLLQILLQHIDFNNCLIVNSRRKKEIADTVGISVQSFDNYMVKIVKADVARRIGRGEYEFNPNYFGKGDWKKLSQHRERWSMTVTYHLDGSRTISSYPSP